MSARGIGCVSDSAGAAGCAAFTGFPDAMGAIGIARCFAYGGYKNRPLYDPEAFPQEHVTAEAYRKSEGSSLNHFYEKLLLLKDRMNTAAAKRLAAERHAFLEEYLRRFMDEWDGKA